MCTRRCQRLVRAVPAERLGQAPAEVEGGPHHVQLREAVVEELIVRQAYPLGLTVAAEELQRAADAFRRRHGLTSAE